MKALILIAGIYLATTLNSASKYEEELTKSITAIEHNSGIMSDYDKLVVKFEELAKTSPNDWYPLYYAALCEVFSAYLSTGASDIDSKLNRAELFLEKSSSLGAEKSEVLCINSMIASARIMVDPNSRGMEFGMKSNELIQKAKELNPDNPRCYLIQAQGMMYTPESFGGGCKGAAPIIEKAVLKYELYKPESNFAPTWGTKDIEKMKKDCGLN